MKRMLFSLLGLTMIADIGTGQTWCLKNQYKVLSLDSDFVEIEFLDSTKRRINLEFKGCRRTYDMYDCLYSNDEFEFFDTKDDGYGGTDYSLMSLGPFCDNF